MHDRKLTLNGILVILIVFSAIYLFATITAFRVMDPSVLNETHPIEGTDYAIRYSTFEQSGIVRGTNSNTAELVLEGNYSVDWGAAAEGDTLYVNAYRATSFGLTLCDVVQIDLAGLKESPLFPNAVLRGRCTSGELVVVSGVMLPANYPESNALCRLYAMGDADLHPDGKEAEILFFDPSSGEIVHRIPGTSAFSDDFEERYLNKTLEEVKACD